MLLLSFLAGLFGRLFHQLSHLTGHFFSAYVRKGFQSDDPESQICSSEPNIEGSLCIEPNSFHREPDAAGASKGSASSELAGLVRYDLSDLRGHVDSTHAMKKIVNDLL